MHQVKYNLSLKLPGFKILSWNSQPGFLSSRTFKWQRVIVSMPVIYNKWLSVRYLLLDGVCICFVLCGLNSEQNKCGGGSLKVKTLPMYILVHSYIFLLFLLLEIDFIYQITRTWRIHIKEISDIRIEHTKRQKVFHQPACQRATPHLLNLSLGCNQLVQELETADCPLSMVGHFYKAAGRVIKNHQFSRKLLRLDFKRLLVLHMWKYLCCH